MIFPDVERIIYQNNPLLEVICQLKYPTILRIDSEQPVQFQEKIRHEYPIFEENPNPIGQIPEQIIQTLPPQMMSQFRGSRSFIFTSADKNWTVSLNREFLALKTNLYTKWEDFQNHFQDPFNTLCEEYKPAFFSRIGLRYQNVIQRSRLGLTDVAWSKLVNSSILGLLASSHPNLNDQLEGTETTSILALDNDSNKVRLRNALVRDESNNEICYLIDADFYTEKQIGINDGLQILNTFNKANRDLFRWCITPQLHEAMGPL